MEVIIDSSVWVDFFKGGKTSDEMEFLIDENFLLTNDIVLAEIVPFLKLKKQKKLVQLLMDVKKLDLVPDWNEIAVTQYKCLNSGVNGIGIPDHLIAQNAQQNGVSIFSLDKHFAHLEKIVGCKLYPFI